MSGIYSYLGYPPAPPMPPLASPNTSKALEHQRQYEIQVRENYIHKLELDNMRLRVTLEQAEKDMKIATRMIVLAGRSESRIDEQQPPKAEASHFRDPFQQHSALDTGQSAAPAAWGESLRRAWDGGPSYNGENEDDPWHLDSVTRAQHGLVDRSEPLQDFGHAFNNSVGPAWLNTDARPAQESANPDLHSFFGSRNGQQQDAGTVPCASVPAREPQSLIDFDDDVAKIRGRSGDDIAGSRWATPPPLPNLTPFLDDIEPVRDATCGDEDATQVRSKVQQVKSRFRHLFSKYERQVFDQDEPKPTTGYEDERKIIETWRPALNFGRSSPDFELQPRVSSAFGITDVRPGGSRVHTLSDGTSHPHVKDEPKHMQGAQISFDSEETRPGEQIGIDSQIMNGAATNFVRSRRPYRNADAETYQERNYNANIPWSVDDVQYKPGPQAKNLYRTIMIYNLSPQTDIAEIVTRAGDVPLLSIKLLPTMGMKYRKGDASIGILDTMTAMMVFAIDSSAEQFVFDLSMDPLVVRGRTAIAKVLQTPTDPTGLASKAYETAPGRLYARRIRLHQPVLIFAAEFDDVLAGNSYGFKQPGWILNRSVRKAAGKNIVTIEFNSIETARFAFDQMLCLRDFQGCSPNWVLDHQYGHGTARQGVGLKMRDDEGSSEGEAFHSSSGEEKTAPTAAKIALFG